MLKQNPEIYVDADACPVKDEVIKVANRHKIKTFMVSDGGIRPYPSTLVSLVIVDQGTDAADDWITENITTRDVVITNDIPLASRCLRKGAKGLKSNGILFTNDSIGMALATRNLMQTLREGGEVTRGPRPFSEKDRSDFLNSLEGVIQNLKKDK
mgnify:CR=1 FL=1